MILTSYKKLYTFWKMLDSLTADMFQYNLYWYEQASQQFLIYAMLGKLSNQKVQKVNELAENTG